MKKHNDHEQKEDYHNNDYHAPPAYLYPLLQELTRHSVDPSIKSALEQLQEQDVTIFIGRTKSGKSTTINLIIGTELESVKQGLKGFKIDLVKKDGNDPKIGLNVKSDSVINMYHLIRH